MKTIAALLLLGATTASAEELVWKTDLEEARELARKTGKPMLVVFR